MGHLETRLSVPGRLSQMINFLNSFLERHSAIFKQGSSALSIEISLKEATKGLLKMILIDFSYFEAASQLLPTSTNLRKTRKRVLCSRFSIAFFQIRDLAANG
jgi:hypothetical protein